MGNNVRIEILKEDLQGVTAEDVADKENFIKMYMNFRYQLKVTVNGQPQQPQTGLPEANLATALGQISSQNGMLGPRKDPKNPKFKFGGPSGSIWSSPLFWILLVAVL